MIQLTRLNGHTLTVNADLIRIAEESPDTTLTLVTGEKLVVKESAAAVAGLLFAHRVALLRTAWPDAAAQAHSAANAFHAHHAAQASE